ncbi:hypothetical protein D3218_01725 [Aureimonas flava]|uniref:Uncharacterized protein n=1 Tax=Aureimonas flava TaxID=2320271 RepID=A0A3A1WR13_9HYPH|nr:hypothetical protein [Aureimonas flava]RIY03503.1 hypothetical protein D3218_01725 [Aureimonas flava]
MSFIFDANETPEQAAKRRQIGMDALRAGATRQPQNMGEGMSAVAQALAYRSMQNSQAKAAADPWSSMRQPAGAGFFARLGGMFR